MTTRPTEVDVHPIVKQIIDRDCHVGESAGVASASSECLACHEFHIDTYGPMSSAHGEAMTTRRNSAERAEVKRETQ